MRLLLHSIDNADSMTSLDPNSNQSYITLSDEKQISKRSNTKCWYVNITCRSKDVV